MRNFSGEDGWAISGENRPDLYHSELARSRMCLAPPGWELWSVRFYESLLLGCVPVILSDGLHLPFETLLDYSSMTIKVLEADLARLPVLLNSVPRERIESKRTAAQRHWKAITFQRPPLSPPPLPPHSTLLEPPPEPSGSVHSQRLFPPLPLSLIPGQRSNGRGTVFSTGF